MYKLILANGTELTGFVQNGTNYVSETKVDESVFSDNLSTLTITDGETEMIMHNAELIQQVHYPNANPPGWYLCFRELTLEEIQYATLIGKIDYLAMMADVEMEE